MVILKSALAATPSHSMMCFKLPKSLTKRIQSAQTRFWWDANPEKKKMCWISWDKLAKPKTEGGLGFRNIETFNDALLAKQGWRILKKPDCLLSKVLLGKYCKYESFMQVKAASSCSHGWRSILCGRDLLVDNTIKTIGNGQDTSVWYDAWYSTEKRLQPMGPP
ncbi:uncharacterized mitochondrial protein AtMg00310-like [Brassica napus]|uniref:uncharacterized mitochondrial protein AtMg00310-like n=1 Tax=Brassica napus TaxID=3708 RepID=UPI00207A386C|nr:uncharacterized mitochondrial protein AtMg00310-like [Brassica napus]